MRSRVAVLASGGGSNLQAILDHFAWLGDRRGGDVVLAVSNRRDAGALERATRAGIDTAVAGGDAETAAASLGQLFERYNIDLIVLAGYLKLVPPPLVARFLGRIVNVHHALLHAFGGPGM